MTGTRILTLIRRAGLEAADAGLAVGLQRVTFIWMWRTKINEIELQFKYYNELI